jgi:hypothetical protein
MQPRRWSPRGRGSHTGDGCSQDWVNKARFNLNEKYNMMFPFLSERVAFSVQHATWQVQRATCNVVIAACNTKHRRSAPVSNQRCPRLDHTRESTQASSPPSTTGSRTFFGASLSCCPATGRSRTATVRLFTASVRNPYSKLLLMPSLKRLFINHIHSVHCEASTQSVNVSVYL